VPGNRVRGYRDTRGLDVAGGTQRPDAKGTRDRAILRLLWDLLGLRRSEVAELDLEHLDLEATTVDVPASQLVALAGQG
jgi:site-specific recombinase XerC